MDKIQSFKDLIVWQKSHALVIKIYKLTQDFPTEERFGLTNQIRRASVSISSNIAEGFGRNSAKDKNQFYAIAKGSALEVQSQTLIAHSLGYVKIDLLNEVEKEIETITKMISGLLKSSVDK